MSSSISTFLPGSTDGSDREAHRFTTPRQLQRISCSHPAVHFPDLSSDMPVETAFVPNFDYDVFISYAWVDNQVDDDEKSAHGWVSQFGDRLIRRIDQKLGRIDSTRVFFDTFAIGKNHDFGPQIETALSKTAVMVVVFSPGYIASKACREELQCFSRVVQEKLSASGRLFLVHLDHVPSAR